MLLVAFLAGPLRAAPEAEEGGAEYQQWTQRLTAAAKRHDAAEEVLCITTIGRRWRWALNTLSHSLIDQAARESEEARIGEPRIEMLQMLFDVRWVQSDGREPSSWWRQLSLDLLQHDRPQEAFAVAAHITDPYSLIILQVDNRYGRIAKSKFVERDILRAAETELKRRQSAAAARPRDLTRIVTVAYALAWLRRYDDILKLTDTVLQRTGAAAESTAPYDDVARDLPWVLDARSRALAALGRYDEALALVHRARDETQADLIGHALNLADLLAELGHPHEALAAFPDLEGASPFQRASAAAIRVIATVQLADQAALDAALLELRSFATAYPNTVELGLVVAGRDDEAAATLVAALVDPWLRGSVLLALQDYARTPFPGQMGAWRERWMALRRRPEVRRAIAEHGQIRSYPIAAP